MLERTCRAESPGINVGRGLKLLSHCGPGETPKESPGINVGRGLKRRPGVTDRQHPAESPGINVGRGLKRYQGRGRDPVHRIARH